MPSRAVDLGTIEEWRELGFFYEKNESPRTWILRGDRTGLKSFVQKLREYAGNSRNTAPSEHEHFGPYFYLTVITGTRPAIENSGLAGTLADFLRLADIIESYLAIAAQREFVISGDFAPGTDWAIQFRVESDGFDPSSVDHLIEHRS